VPLIAVRVGILRNYGDPQTAVAVEGTAIFGKTGNCEMFHVALFFPIFRANRNVDVVQRL
jgi:hypothetical protein